ncbi:MAG: hypothetical protein V4708_12155, partial [Bacteroidota bacterium]
MKKKITKLTKEQESKLESYKDKWVKLGLSTEKTNYKRALAQVAPYYRAGGLDAPRSVIFAGSPYGAMLLLSVLKNLKIDLGKINQV